jgi:valyl-tRNA synthetase
MQFYIHLDSALDLDAERARLQKEIDNISSYITGLEKKLGNEQFTANAPATVVEQERDKLRTAQEKHDALTAELNDLG